MEFRPVSLIFVAVITLMVVVMLPAGADAQLLPQIVVSGTIPCTNVSTIISTISTSTPIFPNATVMIKCGGATVASTTTNSNGSFTIILSPSTITISTLLKGCVVFVDTSLSICNATLPITGNIQAPLQLVTGGFLGGIIGGITNLIPATFLPKIA